MASTGAAQGVPVIPKITTKSYTITLPPELTIRLLKPVTGPGGYQGLMRDLQEHVEGDTLELPESLLDRCIAYGGKANEGGFQTVIRWILCLVLAQHKQAILGTPQTLKGMNGVKGE